MIRVALAAAAALLVSGCATGRVDSGWPFPVEAAAAVSKGGGAPLRQMQVSLADLIATRLQNDGVRIDTNAPKYPRGATVYLGGARYSRTATPYSSTSRRVVPEDI